MKSPTSKFTSDRSPVVNFRNLWNKLTFESRNDMEFWWFPWTASDVFVFVNSFAFGRQQQLQHLWLMTAGAFKLFFFPCWLLTWGITRFWRLNGCIFSRGGQFWWMETIDFSQEKGCYRTHKLIFRSIFGRSTRCSHWVEDRIYFGLPFRGVKGGGSDSLGMAVETWKSDCQSNISVIWLRSLWLTSSVAWEFDRQNLDISIIQCLTP